MSSLNKPDRIIVDSYSDDTLKNLPNSGVFNRITNVYNQPICKVKGIQLTRCNFINTGQQLNDASQLMFFYVAASSTTNLTSNVANLRCVRLLPSWYIPSSSVYTSYTKNQYINNGVELAALLNKAAASGGDDMLYNPKWKPDDVVFSFDGNSRRLSFYGTNASFYYAPIAADNPMLQTYLRTNAITMYAPNGAIPQPYVLGQSMNARLGWAMSHSNQPRFVSGASVAGVASSTGLALLGSSSNIIEADAWPILLGTQSLNIYASVLNNAGYDSQNKRKNLLASIPIDSAPLNVVSHVASGQKAPALKVSSEIYSLDLEFLDECGNPYVMYPNYNFEAELRLIYDDE